MVLVLRGALSRVTPGCGNLPGVWLTGVSRNLYIISKHFFVWRKIVWWHPVYCLWKNSTFRYLNYNSIRSRERQGRSSYMLSVVEARHLEYRCQYRERFHTFWHVCWSIPRYFPICPHDHWAFSRSVMTRIRSSRVVSTCRLPFRCCSRVHDFHPWLFSKVIDFW